MSTETIATPTLTAKDFATDQEVRWCPGCGDYAILKAVQRTMVDLGSDPAKTVFVSGIGCSSRFPYYMASYGFHTIHGRAPAVATGIKLSNPELDVWLVTGDGDGMSIGGNHTMHLLRRNLDCQFLLFNNGLHAAHHETPGTHWSKLRPVHEKLAPYIDPRLIHPSMWGYFFRQYVVAPFFPEFGTQQVGRAPSDPPDGRPSSLQTAEVDLGDAGVTADMIRG